MGCGAALGPASPPAAIKARVSGWRAKGGPAQWEPGARLEGRGSAGYRMTHYTTKYDSSRITRFHLFCRCTINASSSKNRSSNVSCSFPLGLALATSNRTHLIHVKEQRVVLEVCRGFHQLKARLAMLGSPLRLQSSFWHNLGKLWSARRPTGGRAASRTTLPTPGSRVRQGIHYPAAGL